MSAWSRVIIAFAIETVIRLPKASKKHAPFAATFSDMPLGTPANQSVKGFKSMDCKNSSAPVAQSVRARYL